MVPKLAVHHTILFSWSYSHRNVEQNLLSSNFVATILSHEMLWVPLQTETLLQWLHTLETNVSPLGVGSPVECLIPHPSIFTLCMISQHTLRGKEQEGTICDCMMPSL